VITAQRQSDPVEWVRMPGGDSEIKEGSPDLEIGDNP
jgi:hypothetical protein